MLSDGRVTKAVLTFLQNTGVGQMITIPPREDAGDATYNPALWILCCFSRRRKGNPTLTAWHPQMGREIWVHILGGKNQGLPWSHVTG